MADGSGTRRGVLRLVVPTPDGSRVLARPNGLAGWALPALAIDLPFRGWDPASVAGASRVVGVSVTPASPIGESAWAVTAQGRIPTAGRAWIGLEELDRLGADAGIVRSWMAGTADLA